MLKVFELSAFQPYSNKPRIDLAERALRLSTALPAIPGNYLIGMARFILPRYAAGDRLQWAMLAKAPIPVEILKLRVQDGAGNENNLWANFSVENKWAWMTSPVHTVDVYREVGFLFTPEPNKVVFMRALALGDPASIARLTRSEDKGLFPMAVLGLVGATLLGLVVMSKRKQRR